MSILIYNPIGREEKSYDEKNKVYYVQGNYVAMDSFSIDKLIILNSHALDEEWFNRFLQYSVSVKNGAIVRL